MSHPRVDDVMIRELAFVDYGATLETAAAELLNAGADAAIVRCDDGRIMGLLTERGLVMGAQAVASGSGPDEAGHYVDRGFVLGNADDNAESLVNHMAESGVPRAIIVDDESIAVGLVSLRVPAMPSVVDAPRQTEFQQDSAP